MTLTEYIKELGPPGPFKALPFHNKEGKQIEWYWKDDDCYAESIMVDGKWAGSVYKSNETGEICGVNVHLEAIKE